MNLERPGPLLIELRGSRSGHTMSVIASEMITLDLWSICVFSGLFMWLKNSQVKCDAAVLRPYHKTTTVTRSNQNEKLSIAMQLAGFRGLLASFLAPMVTKLLDLLTRHLLANFPTRPTTETQLAFSFLSEWTNPPWTPFTTCEISWFEENLCVADSRLSFVSITGEGFQL